jgi:ketosteroid isomerase-like protein
MPVVRGEACVGHRQNTDNQTRLEPPRIVIRRKPAVASETEDQVVAAAREWDRAMVGNDAADIGAFMADEWTVIVNDGGVCDKAAFLELVRSGVLSHDVMASQELRVRVYGDTAVVTGRGVSGGLYQGQAFHAVERVSCVFVRREGRWRCVLTHTSKLLDRRVD